MLFESSHKKYLKWIYKKITVIETENKNIDSQYKMYLKTNLFNIFTLYITLYTTYFSIILYKHLWIESTGGRQRVQPHWQLVWIDLSLLESIEISTCALSKASLIDDYRLCTLPFPSVNRALSSCQLPLCSYLRIRHPSHIAKIGYTVFR